LFYDLVAGTTQRAQNLSIGGANWPSSAGRTLIGNQTVVQSTADAPSATPTHCAYCDSIQFGAVLDPRIKNVYSEQWNFEIQRELAANLALSAAYVGSHNLRLAIGRRLQYRRGAGSGANRAEAAMALRAGYRVGTTRGAEPVSRTSDEGRAPHGEGAVSYS